VLFWLWLLAGHAIIRDERGVERPMTPNRSQKRIWLAIMDQAAAENRVRLRIGKARRGGTSTFICALRFFVCWNWGLNQGYCIAHRDETVDALQRMGKRFAQGMGGGQEFLARIHRYANGSFDRFATSGGQAVGAGDTLSILHWSERAKWGDHKDDTARDTSIAAEWAEIIIDESTFQGRDQFWTAFDAARNGEGEYRAMFIAWFEDERCTVGICDSFPLDDEEKQLVRLASSQGIELSPGQLRWRRQKLADPDMGDARFRQEYPSTPEEAVQAGKGLILPFSRSWIVDDVPFEYLSVPWPLRVGGIDFGYNDPCVIWSGVHWDGCLYLIGCWRSVQSLSGEQLGGLMLGHTYWCDPANLSDRKALAKAAGDAGLQVTLRPAPRKRHPGEDFEKSELHRLIDFAAAERLHVLRDVSEQLIAECDTLEWNEQTGKPKMPRTEQCGHFDTVMALKYCVAGVLRTGEPQAPRDGTTKIPSRRSSFARY